jgi:hypothetical protein
MIKSITFNNIEKCPLPWVSKAFKNGTKIEFEPGINLLLGPIGTGKSALLSLIATYFHCKQGGFQCLTDQSMQDLKNIEDSLNAVSFEHDGYMIKYFAPFETHGLIGGGAAFDFDFFDAGVRNCMMKCSNGQKSLDRFVQTFKSVTPFDKLKNFRHKNIDIIKEFLFKSTLSNLDFNPIPTALFDEPELSLDPLLQEIFWKKQVLNQKNIQFVIASHSYFAIKTSLRKDVNVINFGDDKEYLQKVKKSYQLT